MPSELKITLDSTELRELLDPLEALLERLDPSVDFREPLKEFFVLKNDDNAALAGELRIRLQPTDALRRFVLALRARNVDGRAFV